MTFGTVKEGPEVDGGETRDDFRFPLCAVGQMELRCDGRMFLSHYLDSRPGCGASEMREEGQVALCLHYSSVQWGWY